jgi:hypothetical protein
MTGNQRLGDGRPANQWPYNGNRHFGIQNAEASSNKEMSATFSWDMTNITA